MPLPQIFRISLRRRSLAIFCMAGALAGGEVRADLKLEPSEVDLGRARQEQVVHSTVKLSNVGSSALEIKQVGADCSCTAATPKKTKLAPGESTDLEVTFETRSYQGEVRRRLLIQTSEGDISLPVKAVVSAFDDWSIASPSAMVAPSNKGEKASGAFTVEYIGSGAANIVSAETDAPWLEAKVGEHTGAQWKIEMEKRPNAPAGNHQPTVTLHTSDAHEPLLKVKAFVPVYSSLSIRPNPLLLPVGKVGKPLSMPFEISGWQEKEDPRGEVPGGTVTVQKRDRSEILLSIEIAAPQAGTSTRLLKLYAGESVEAEIPVIVRAED